MISLTPIAKKIQRKLFEKMRAFGRVSTPNASVPTDTTLAELQSRSPFVKMASQLKNPVVMNGGELVDGERVAAGYGELYSEDLHRPIPGVKSIEVGFLGGNKAIREATINWTCWSFDEIDRLTPHFLSPGQTVLLEWGWVYNKNTLINLPTFINSKGEIKKSAYTNYKNTIISAEGDFDMMVGVVKNYNFTSREDGGFDCQTIISGMGTNMLKSTEPNKNATSSDIVYKIKQEFSEEKLTQTPMTVKMAVENIDLYIKDKLSVGIAAGNSDQGNYKVYTGTKKKYKESIVATGVDGTYYNYIPNQFIIEYSIPTKGAWANSRKPENITNTLNVWVKWGWFEDNILSKFTTKFSDESGDVPEADFRSVEAYIDTEGNENGLYEPTRIRNHPNFETVDVEKFIVPGQFKPFKRPKNPPEGIQGDREGLHALKTIVDINFQAFAPDSKIEQSISYTVKEGDNLTAISKKLGTSVEKIQAENLNIKNPSAIKVGQELTVSKLKRKPNGKIDRTTGYFRNLLINTNLIKQAFGVSDTDEYTAESVDIDDALHQLFPLLNQDIHMWDFEIINDETKSYRSKIVDTKVIIPFPSADQPIDSPFVKSKTSKSTYSDGDVTNNGVFYFPAWQPDSLVKGQNITSTIPSSMAMSIMYGAKAPVVNTAGNPQPDSSAEGTGTGQFSKDANNPPVNNSLVSIIRKEGFERYGYKGRNDNIQEPLGQIGFEMLGDDDLQAFFKDSAIANLIGKTRKEKQQAQDEQEEVIQDSKVTKLEDSLDPSVPPPPPDRLVKLVPDFFNSLKELKIPQGGRSQKLEHPLIRLYSSKYDKNDRLKKPFIDSVNYNMQTSKVIKTETIVENNQPIKMPIELELTIDGIGGIYPGNSYHSTYLPTRYQKESIFQAFDINHTVDSSGWTTTISGKMRSTLERTMNVSTSTRTVNILDTTDQANATLAKASEGQDKIVQANLNTAVDTGVGSNDNQLVEGGYIR